MSFGKSQCFCLGSLRLMQNENDLGRHFSWLSINPVGIDVIFYVLVQRKCDPHYDRNQNYKLGGARYMVVCILCRCDEASLTPEHGTCTKF